MQNFVRVFLAFASIQFAYAASAEDLAADARNKINLAGKQRTLIQQVAKASCFARLDDEHAKAHHNEAAESIARFDRVLTGLRNGDEGLELLPSEQPEVLAALGEVEAQWAPFKDAALRSLEAGSGADAAFSRLVSTDMKLLAQMDETVGVVQTMNSASGGIDPNLAKTINTAGRQRTLVQQSAKAFCLKAVGVDPVSSARQQAEAVQSFDAAMKALVAPREDLVAPSSAIAKNLGRVDAIWQSLSTSYDAYDPDAPTASEDAAVIAAQNNRVLREMNRIVYMYALTQ
ncbi:MAG: type IV pili methyl-accepting chemotaxis transducer N-terminal domain-containing protein [Pseudomonadota bacterium]